MYCVSGKAIPQWQEQKTRFLERSIHMFGDDERAALKLRGAQAGIISGVPLAGIPWHCLSDRS